jgi:hypothetical protein
MFFIYFLNELLGIIKLNFIHTYKQIEQIEKQKKEEESQRRMVRAAILSFCRENKIKLGDPNVVFEVDGQKYKFLKRKKTKIELHRIKNENIDR